MGNITVLKPNEVIAILAKLGFVEVHRFNGDGVATLSLTLAQYEVERMSKVKI